MSWEMDHDTALDLAHDLGILQDLLRLASHEVVDEVATFPIARPLDASGWAHWLAEDLGDQVVVLRTAAPPTTGTEPTPTGDLP